MEKIMVLDLQILFNLAVGAVIAAIGWFFRQLWEDQKILAKDIKQIEIGMPTNYVRRGEFMETMREIRDMFTRITDKLDGKADK